MTVNFNTYSVCYADRFNFFILQRGGYLRNPGFRMLADKKEQISFFNSDYIRRRRLIRMALNTGRNQ